LNKTPWIVVPVVVLTLLTGCLGGSGSSAESGDPSFPPARVSSAISWHGNFGDTLEPNGIVEQEMERRFGVSIDYVNAGSDTLPLLAASNGMPDVIRIPEPSDIADYAKAGLLLELPESLLKKRTPGIYEAINAVSPNLWELSSYDGHNYAIPQYVRYVGWDTAMKWRTDILELAGIRRTPRTVAEYDAAFEAISDRKAAIIQATNPELQHLYMFSGTDMSLAWNQMTWLFGAYGSMPGTWQLGEDGRVVRGELLPGTRDALLKLREWYAAGYIDPAFVTDRAEQFADKWENGQYALNGASSFVSDAVPPKPGEAAKPTDAKLLANVPNAKFAWEKPPIGPEGRQSVFSWGQRQNFFALSARLKDEPEKLDKVLDMIETIATDESLWLLGAYGIEGESYRLRDDGRPVFLRPYDDRLTPEAKRMGALGPASPFAPFAGLEVADRFDDKDVADVWQRLNAGVTDVLFGLPLDSARDMEPRNQEKWTETMVEILTGERPISYYDDYVAWFNENGGEQWTEEANRLYAERFKGR